MLKCNTSHASGIRVKSYRKTAPSECFLKPEVDLVFYQKLLALVGGSSFLSVDDFALAVLWLVCPSLDAGSWVVGT